MHDLIVSDDHVTDCIGVYVMLFVMICVLSIFTVYTHNGYTCVGCVNGNLCIHTGYRMSVS